MHHAEAQRNDAGEAFLAGALRRIESPHTEEPLLRMTNHF